MGERLRAALTLATASSHTALKANRLREAATARQTAACRPAAGADREYAPTTLQNPLPGPAEMVDPTARPLLQTYDIRNRAM